ncbi:hypothetical protein FJY69_06310 [candidate division WOR-3 bacterium]|nr:hypothetical protein [candidate division WOR-3 bacterium]
MEMSMWHEFKDEKSEFSDDEIDAVSEFTEALVRGERPVPEAYLARRPELAERLGPLFETAQWLEEEFRQFRLNYPEVRARHLLDRHR